MASASLLKVLSRTAFFLTVAFPLMLIAGSVPANAGLAVIGLLFLLHCALMRDWSWLRLPWVQCLLALWAYMIARGTFAEFPPEALGRALPFGRYFIFAAALATWTLRDESTRERFFNILLAVLLFCIADGLLQRFMGVDILRRPIPYDTLHHIRLTGPFSKPCLGIVVTWLCLPVSFMLLMTKQGSLQRGMRLAGGIAFSAGILAVVALSGERMALLLLLFGWGIAVFLLPLPRRILMAAFAVFVLLIAGLAMLSPEIFQRQILMTLDTFAHWKESPYGLLLSSDMRMAEINPVFGVGTMHFRYACRAAFAATPDLIGTNCNTHPHNIYMEWLIENGVIGLALFGAAVVFILLACRKAWATQRLNPIFPGLLIAFILRVWPIESSTGLFSTWGAPPLWLITGALLAYCAKPRLSAGSDGQQ